MDKIAAYIAAKDTTMDKESPDNDFSDKGYISHEDYIADKEKFTDTEHQDSDHSDKEFTDKEYADKNHPDKDDIADEDIEAKDNIMAKDNIAEKDSIMDKDDIAAKDDITAKDNCTIITSHPCKTDVKDKEESPVSPTDPSGSGSPRSQRPQHPKQEPEIRRPRHLLAQGPTGAFEFPKSKDAALSRNGQDGAAPNSCSQG